MQRHKFGHPARLALLTLATYASTTGCVVHLDGSLDVGDDVDADGSSDDASSDDGSSDGSSDDASEQDPGCTPAVDILFVIDNSGSMGSRQRQVAEAIDTLVARLDAASMDWRIGVTTTDNGNPWCAAGVSMPAAGLLTTSSCRERLDSFLFSDVVDVQDEACRDVCDHEELHIASTVDAEGVVREGTWVGRFAGGTNVYDADNNPIDPVEALRCLLPQGVNGCGFEAPLESMAVSLARMADVNSDQFGFLRDEAQLAVVIVSDEADCSYNEQWAGIFEPDGDKAFWSDPNDPFPTSAVCWNAGVQCVGEGPEYANCVAADKDEHGNLLGLDDDPAANAVMHPIARYNDLLTQLQADKQADALDPVVQVFGVVGIGLDAQLHFADSEDTAFQASFGIGPGCVGDGEGNTAVPPGRMREVINESGGAMYSVCRLQYADAFQAIGNRLVGECGQ